jgi:O-antigen ligase
MTGRTRLWASALHAFTTSPLVGVGAGAFPAFHERNEGWRQVVHSTPLSVAAELGLAGLALFFGALVRDAWRVVRIRGGPRAAVVGMLAVWLVGTLSLTWEHRKTTWFVFGIVMSAGALAAAARGGRVPNAS